MDDCLLRSKVDSDIVPQHRHKRPGVSRFIDLEAEVSDEDEEEEEEGDYADGMSLHRKYVTALS